MEKQGPLGIRFASVGANSFTSSRHAAARPVGHRPNLGLPGADERHDALRPDRHMAGVGNQRVEIDMEARRQLYFGQKSVSPRQPWARSAAPSANRSAESCACPPRSGGCHPPVQRPTRSPAPTPRLPICNEVSFRSPWVPVFADGSYCALMSTHPSRVQRHPCRAWFRDAGSLAPVISLATAPSCECVNLIEKRR